MYFFLILITFSCAETSVDLGQVDRFLAKAKEQNLNGNYSAAYKIANQALQLAEKNHDSGAKARVYLAIAKIAYTTQNSKNLSFLYIQKAENEVGFQDSPALKARASSYRGDIYIVNNAPDLALIEYKKQLIFAKTIPNTEERALAIANGHLSLCGFYVSIGDYNAALFHLKLWENILRTVKEEKAYPSLIYFYLRKVTIAINQKKINEAQSNLDKAVYLCRKYGNQKELRNAILPKFGDLEDAKGNKTKALDFYKQKLNDDIKLNNKESEFYMYSFLREYIISNKFDQREAYGYLINYQRLRESLDVEKGKFVEIVLRNVAAEKDLQQKNKSHIYIFIILSGIITLFMGGIFWYQWHIRNKKLIFKSKKSLKIMNETTIQLEKKIEENKFNDLLILAKNNNPEFLILFTELYPHFIHRLKSIDPKIRSSELSFCAMAYLNFSTKDIAAYTFVTVGAVEMRRSRLRKKYNIPSDIDFNNWMREQV